ncbi:hypothetical protein MNBD_GAMMA12-3990, partial [hydrothermal vent metagenome]
MRPDSLSSGQRKEVERTAMDGWAGANKNEM